MAKKEDGPKRLYRSKQDKVIAGVCGGIAEYLVVDPVWIRLAAVLLIFFNGTGVVLYIIAWILMPVNPNQKDKGKTKAEEIVENIKSDKRVVKIKKQKTNATPLVGLIIIILGLAFLFRNFFAWMSFDYVWPIVIILIGVYLLAGKKR